MRAVALLALALPVAADALDRALACLERNLPLDPPTLAGGNASAEGMRLCAVAATRRLLTMREGGDP